MYEILVEKIVFNDGTSGRVYVCIFTYHMTTEKKNLVLRKTFKDCYTVDDIRAQKTAAISYIIF